MIRLVASFPSLLVVAGLAAAAEPPTVPRYKFKPGQEITYRSTGTFKYGEKKTAGEHGTTVDWTVWVVRANEDGSFRLVLREEEAFFEVSAGKKREHPTEKRLVYADVFPDGRILPNDTIRYRGHPEPIFPRLPRDAAEAARGWSWERDGDRFGAQPLKADKGFRFEIVSESPLNAIYLSSSKTAYTFDPARGLVSAAETATTQGSGFIGKGTDTTELLGVKATDPAQARQLASEERAYFRSVTDYDKAFEAARGLGPAEAGKRLAAAAAALEAANKALTHPALRAAQAARIERHEQTAKYTLEEAERREKVVGKPAEPFDTTDMNGKSVKLADLKGKVVVLDFWYRGCGWCIKAMPQMNGLAEDFAGKPVAILGMNTDRKEEDAKWVIEKMGLKYPTLKAIGLPQKFGVEGFPTLIVIDQEGKIREMHVGYSPTLRQDVGRRIRALLEKK
jgi:thiol-disulfide isomerase/thioredoxin